ncbi:MAG: chemotaxis protein CheA, partial [Clostridia bacterium]|nr:chemotaxis protein CheA [Deltaproteobacteria bacterium]
MSSIGGGVSVEFVAEAQEIVDALGRDLIGAEQETRGKPNAEVDPDRVNNLFRSAHSLKGLAGMFGLDALSRLAHELESVLDGMRLGKVRFDEQALDVLFASVERAGTLIAQASGGEVVPVSAIDDLAKKLERVAKGQPEGKETEGLAGFDLGEDVLSVLTEYEEHRLRENIAKGRQLYMLRTSFDLTNFDVGLAEIDVTVKKLGEVITKLPSSKAADPGAISFDIIVGSEATSDDLARAIGDERVEVVPIARKRRAAPFSVSVKTDNSDLLAALIEPEAGDESSSVRSVSRTVRVDIRRLDRLMNLVGELGLTRAAFMRITEDMRREHGFIGLAVDLHKEGRAFERRLAELQAGIMEVRMVPLTNLFERMQRIGRKIGRELQREVRVETRGENTELDKLIVEDLADPLMHLIRNSLDHGIEPPNERVAGGKPGEGVVRLSAAAQGNHVVVEVSDDGRGIDVQRVVKIALERKLIPAERAQELSRREIFNLLFLPGFSTRDEVSAYSGRGVGLDVVRTNISQLSGVIDVDSVEGQGTTFTVTLPITLAIIPALIVAVAGRTYAIPLNNVQETLALTDVDVRTIERREVISLRGSTVPLVDLRKLFNLDKETKRPNTVYGVIAGAGVNRMALVVDDLVAQQDIVIKSLGKWLRNTPGIAGAAELGNQHTILVIDMVELLG